MQVRLRYTTALATLWLFILLALPTSVPAQPGSLPTGPLTNMDFEAGEPGQVPPGWTPSRNPAKGYAVRLVTENPQAGRMSAQVAQEGEVVDTAVDEPARPLSPQGVDNLFAFTRLLGYVRYFHPSDQAAAADWNQVAIAGVQAVEGATGPEDLAERLEAFFRPLAPTLRVFPTSRQQPALPAELTPPAGSAELEVTAWEHHGVDLGAPSQVYSSQRISEPPASPEASGFPRPNGPLLANLSGGASALIPLALYEDAQGTLPHPVTGTPLPPPKKAEGFLPTGNDRATRLADVALAWNVFQHFYPYFDVVETDWRGELHRALRSAATDADGRAFLDTLRRMVAALHDGHGSVSASTAGGVACLPLAFAWVEDQFVVTDTGAEAGGLARGDVIVSLNGKPAREALEAEEALTSGSTPQWRRYRAMWSLTAGPAGEEVKVTARRGGAEPFAVTLKRSLPPGGPGSLEEKRPEKIAEVRPGIFYVDIGRISDEDFKGAVDRLAAARGVVFDLRGYPALSPIVISHLTGEPVTSARWNVPRFTRPDREGMTFDFSNWTVEPLEPRIRGKVAFLTDGRAISYAETYMGIIESYKLAEIVGGPTAGTNGNVNPFVLPGGYRVRWTGMQVLKHDGSRHHGVGIQPTVPVSRTLKGVAEGRDEILERGIEVVSAAVSGK